MPFTKGRSGNPGGRPKWLGQVRDGLADFLPEAIAKLKALCHSEDDKVALMAVREVFDRTVGRAAVLDENGNVAPVIKVMVPEYGEDDKPEGE